MPNILSEFLNIVLNAMLLVFLLVMITAKALSVPPEKVWHWTPPPQPIAQHDSYTCWDGYRFVWDDEKSTPYSCSWRDI